MRHRCASCARPDHVVLWNVVIAQPLRPALVRVVTPDGQRNVWFVGDGSECAVIDPAGDVGVLLGHCDGRRLRAILWTNIWPESVAVAISLADQTGAETYLHADDLVIWKQAEPERLPQHSVPQGMVLDVGTIKLESIHTPGITPGALCWHAPALSAVFTGETLGVHGPDGVDTSDVSAPDRYTVLASIRTGLFTLPSETVVHPAHGVDTRIGTQRWDRRLWS